MKFSLSWLKEHIDFLPDVKLNSIINGLTDLGLEVEKVDNSSNKLKDFIVAEILDISRRDSNVIVNDTIWEDLGIFTENGVFQKPSRKKVNSDNEVSGPPIAGVGGRGVRSP